MGIFARAVVLGFGFSLGAALYKHLSEKLERERARARERTAEPKNSDPTPPPEPAAE